MASKRKPTQRRPRRPTGPPSTKTESWSWTRKKAGWIVKQTQVTKWAVNPTDDQAIASAIEFVEQLPLFGRSVHRAEKDLDS